MRAPQRKCEPPVSFFKFIRPGLKCQLSIPKAFTKHMKIRRNNNTAILRRGCQQWAVKIVDHCVFGEGWETFVKGNGVQDFDFVVFKHEGDMVFDTMVFDTSCCERDYPINKATIIDAERACPEEKSLHNCKIDTSAEGILPNKADTSYPAWTKRKILSINKRIGNKLIRSHSEAELRDPNTRRKRVKFNAQAERHDSYLINKSMKSLLMAEETRIPHHSYFIGTLKPCNCKNKLYLPKTFVLSNGLSNGEMILKNVENEGSWKVKLTDYLGTCFYVHRGWHEFRTANGFEQGDAFLFKLIQNGEKPVVNISRISKETSKVKASQNRYFKSIATAYSIKRSVLAVPMDFARANGLDNRNCEMVVMDEKQRVWATKICHVVDRVVIRGFHKMIVANGLKEGDEFLFGLVDNGNRPLMNFCRISKETSKVKASQNRYFKSIATAHSIKRSVLAVPMDFARANGLDNRNCEMVVMDEKQRVWATKLCHVVDRVVIRGFHKMIVANGLKEGDEFLFELVDNGNRPLMNFCKTGNKLTSCHSEAELKVPNTGSMPAKFNGQREWSNLINKSMKSLLKAGESRIPDHNHRPCFILTLKSVSSTMKLYLPRAFALSNGLIDGEMFLNIVGNEDLWTVNVRNFLGKFFYLYHGWREFCIANGFEQGDTLQFELIQKGIKPVANISRISKETLMGKAAHNPCFKSSATPCSKNFHRA